MNQQQESEEFDSSHNSDDATRERAPLEQIMKRLDAVEAGLVALTETCRAHDARLAALEGAGATPATHSASFVSSSAVSSSSGRTNRSATAGAAQAKPVTRSVKTPPQLGINDDTLRVFKVQAHPKGWHYPTTRDEKLSGPRRAMLAESDSFRPKYIWLNHGGSNRPICFNLALTKSNLNFCLGQTWVVESEFEVMLMHQNGFYTSVSVFDQDLSAYDGLAEALAQMAPDMVHSAFSLDVIGRECAVALAQACEKYGLPYRPHEFIGLRGHNVFSEFELQKFDKLKFQSRMKSLPVVDKTMLREWERDPEQGLPPEPTKGRRK
jgi:hypothetical protein